MATPSDKEFIEESTNLLNSISVKSDDLDKARLAHRLSAALQKLNTVIDHAQRQFDQGNLEAEFNWYFINNLKKDI